MVDSTQNNGRTTESSIKIMILSKCKLKAKLLPEHFNIFCYNK